MLTSVTITYDIADLVGVDFDARRTKVYVTTNVDSVIDTVGNQIRLGDGLGTIASDGTGSVSVWVPGTGSNPATWQTYVHIDYAPRSPGAKRETLTYGPFTITTAGDLADLVQEQVAIPTATASDYATAAGASATSAATSATASAASATSAATSADEAEAAAAAAVDISGISTADGVVEALVKNTGGGGPLTSAALAAIFEPLATKAIEGVPFTTYGHSYLTQDSMDAGSKIQDRIVARANTQAVVNRGVGGTKLYQIAAQIASTWTPNARGLALLICCVNDALAYATAGLTGAGLATARESFRTALAYLTAQSVLTKSSVSFAYSTGWTSGTTTTATSYVDVAWTGDTAYLLLTFTNGSATSVTIDKSGTGGRYATINTGNYAQTSFTGAVKMSGFGAGDHSVRVTLASGSSLGVVGLAIPSTAAPTIAWVKEGATLYPPPGSTVANGNAALAAIQSACATVASDFPTVVPVPVGSDWDPATMLHSDLLHPNDKGAAYYTDRVLAALATQTFRQGLNQISTSLAVSPAYTPVVPDYYSGSPAAPGAPTTLVASAASATTITLTWNAPPSNGSAITAYKVYRGTTSGSLTLVATLGNVLTTTDTGLTTGTPYFYKVSAVNGIGEGAQSSESTATPATPFDANSYSNLRAWYKADSIAQADNTTVATWPDSTTGGALPLSQPPSSTLPTLRTTAGPNSKPIVRFVQASFQKLASSGSVVAATDLTVFAVVAPTSTSQQFLFNLGSTNKSIITGYTAGSYEFFDNPRLVVGSYTVGTFAVVEYVATTGGGGTAAGFKNGTAGATSSSPPANAINNNLYIGGTSVTGGGVSNYADVDVAELIVFNRALNSTERGQIRAALGLKYGITVV